MDHSFVNPSKFQLPQRWDETVARGILESQANSALSVKRFCSRHGIGVARFWYWRARLRKSPRRSLNEGGDCGGFTLLDSGVTGASVTRVQVKHEKSGLSLYFEGGRDLGFIVGDALSRAGLR